MIKDKEEHMVKKLGIISLVFWLMAFSILGFAQNETIVIDEDKVSFEDVTEEDWFYEPVMKMVDYGIINGYGDGTFRPNAPVLREEFAKMMVLALDLEVKSVTSTFVDVADGYWASPWIETAKPYLTGYIRNGEYLYKPQENAAREDMAVALVKAFNLEVNESMLSVLDDYVDQNEISSNLRQHMASAVFHEVMVGYEDLGIKNLKPKSDLSRAEAAKLILSLINDDEKVVFDDEKVIFEEGSFSLKASLVESGYNLSWDYKGELPAKAYKIVASKSNTKPTYPEDGYTDYVDTTTYALQVGNSYVNGDFEAFESGETYYVSISAITDGESLSSDVLKLTMPEVADISLVKPIVKAVETEEGILLKWDKIEHLDLNGYKIVASTSNASPTYPNDGYLAWLTDVDQVEYLIKPGTLYNGGDLGGSFKSGQEYYLNITAIYDKGNKSGEGVLAQMSGEINSLDLSTEKIPKVTGKIMDNKIYLSWDTIDNTGLQGYKIVASKSNPNPVYHQDGYAKWITDLSVKEIYLSPYTYYNGGDIGGKLMPNENYYFSVTAVYNDGKVAGNAVQLRMPLME
jgi:hypothetical protein